MYFNYHLIGPKAFSSHSKWGNVIAKLNKWHSIRQSVWNSKGSKIQPQPLTYNTLITTQFLLYAYAYIKYVLIVCVSFCTTTEDIWLKFKQRQLCYPERLLPNLLLSWPTPKRKGSGLTLCRPEELAWELTKPTGWILELRFLTEKGQNTTNEATLNTIFCGIARKALPPQWSQWQWLSFPLLPDS